MRHEPKRAWLTPWKRRCRCGCAWYPCPDAATVEPPPVVLSLSGSCGLDHAPALGGVPIFHPCPTDPPGALRRDNAMTVHNSDPLWPVAERVADCFSEHGYAFVEDDKLEALAAALRFFLTATGMRDLRGAWRCLRVDEVGPAERDLHHGVELGRPAMPPRSTRCPTAPPRPPARPATAPPPLPARAQEGALTALANR